MFRICSRNLINHHQKVKLKLPKHNKYKNYIQPNLIFLHSQSANLQLNRNIHTSFNLNARAFMDSENVYAYNVLQKIPITDPEFFKLKIPNNAVSTLEEFNSLLDQNYRLKSASEIVETFKNVLDFSKENNINVSDQRFNKLVDGLMDQVENLTDTELSELLVCLAALPQCDSYMAQNFHDIWSALDDICCWKMQNWSHETRFLFAEHWYRLQLGKLSDFLYDFIDKMQNRLKSMSKNEVIHALVYFKIHKRHKLSFEFQDLIDRHIGDMSLDEVALAAMAFIPTKTKIKLSSTVECMISKLKQDLQSADEICIRRIVEVRKVAKFTSTFIDNLGQKTERLSRNQLLYTFFYLNVCRKRFVDFSYEQSLEKHIYSLNVDEMAIVAMGFFKSQSRIRLKPLLGLMIEQVKKECRTVHEIPLTAVLKVLRYSSHMLLIDQLVDLLDHLVPEIDRLSNLCCIHIALLGTTLQFFHKESLQRISEKIVAQISDPEKIRLKDMERLLVALTMFDFDPQTKVNIFDAVFRELQSEKRQKEFTTYPRCLPSCLNLLIMRNIYSHELINHVLDMDRITELYTKNPKLIPRDLLSLDASVEAECPDYNGNRLHEDFRRRVTKWHLEYTPSRDQFKKLSAVDRFVLSVMDVLAIVVQGQQNFHANHVLPNFVKSDLIICRNGQGKFVQPKGFDEYILGDIMRPKDKSLEWFAVVPVGWNNTIRHTSIPLGLISMKCRQLKAIGYKPVLVIWNEFSPLQDNDKIEYIRNKIR